MAKRKVLDSEEDSTDYSEEHSSDSGAKSKSKGKAKQKAAPTVKKPTRKQLDSESESASESESGEEDERPAAKKAKREQRKPSPSGVKVLKNKDGEKYIDLGKKKHATVRTFKGIHLLDIREFYEAQGEEKPGKKGISLTLDQWNALKAAGDTIDKLFQEVKK